MCVLVIDGFNRRKSKSSKPITRARLPYLVQNPSEDLVILGRIKVSHIFNDGRHDRRLIAKLPAEMPKVAQSAAYVLETADSQTIPARGPIALLLDPASLAALCKRIGLAAEGMWGTARTQLWRSSHRVQRTRGHLHPAREETRPRYIITTVCGVKLLLVGIRDDCGISM